MAKWRHVVSVALAALLAACQPAPRPAPAVTPAAARPLGPARLFSVDGAASSITLKVYRDGPLARFGHNHVIVLPTVRGTAYLREPLGDSRFELQIPAADAVVDRSADRQRAGADFPGEISAADAAGTRRNMLGPRLLTADLYPLIELQALAVRGTLPALTWRVRVQLSGIATELEMPSQITIDGDRIVADGQLTLSQQQLGLTPFSVLGGGLRVRDSIDVSYHVVAVANGGEDPHP